VKADEGRPVRSREVPRTSSSAGLEHSTCCEGTGSRKLQLAPARPSTSDRAPQPF
jgi:hypothetical protein